MKTTLQIAKKNLDSVKTSRREKSGYSANLCLHFNGLDDNEDVIILPLRHLSKEQYLGLLANLPYDD